MSYTEDAIRQAVAAELLRRGLSAREADNVLREHVDALLEIDPNLDGARLHLDAPVHATFRPREGAPRAGISLGAIARRVKAAAA